MSWAGKTTVKKVFGSLFKKEQAPSSSYAGVPPLTAAQTHKVERAIQHYAEEKMFRFADTTVQQSAERMGLDSKLLFRYFAEQGSDFRTWRCKLRIEEAKELLLTDSDTPVSTIARRVGFSDRSNFGHQFKAYTGKTPEEWRNNLEVSK